MVHNKFVIVLPWITRNAELELVKRVQKAARNLNIDYQTIDRKGLIVDQENIEQLGIGNVPVIPHEGKPDYGEVDFIIQPHTALAKNQDVFSFVYLGTPLDQLFTHGFEEWTANLLTHDDFLSCGSVSCEHQVTRSLQDDCLHLPPSLHMYASVCEPFISPVFKHRKLFYITSGWDKGRHKNLLSALDEKNLVNIYGAKTYTDLSEYRNYHGELPFDGQAVVHKISELGVALVISSKAHIQDGVMTNRLFEGLAAGAVIICDENPFASHHFGDTLLYIDTRKPDLYGQVKKHMDWVNENPEEAKDMAIRAQKILIEKFSAESFLKRIYERLEERKEELRFGLNPSAQDNPRVHIIYLLLNNSEQALSNFKEHLCKQDYQNIRITVAMDASLSLDKQSMQMFEDHASSIEVMKIEDLTGKSISRMGKILTEVLQHLQNKDSFFDFFNIVLSSEKIFSNHISSLMRIMRRNPDKDVAATAEVFDRPEWPSDDFPRHWDIEKCYKPQNSVEFSHALNFFTTGFARFLFAKKALTNIRLDLLPYLNRKAIVALLHPQSIASSGLATVASSIEHPFFQQAPTHGEDLIIGQVYPEYLRLHSPIITLQEETAQQLDNLNSRMAEADMRLTQGLDSLNSRMAETDMRLTQGLERDKRKLRKSRRRQRRAILLLLVLVGASLLHQFWT